MLRVTLPENICTIYAIAFALQNWMEAPPTFLSIGSCFEIVMYAPPPPPLRYGWRMPRSRAPHPLFPPPADEVLLPNLPLPPPPPPPPPALDEARFVVRLYALLLVRFLAGFLCFEQGFFEGQQFFSVVIHIYPSVDNNLQRPCRSEHCSRLCFSLSRAKLALTIGRMAASCR